MSTNPSPRSGGRVSGTAVARRSPGRRVASLGVRVLLAGVVLEVALRVGFFAYSNLVPSYPCGGPPMLMRMFYAYRNGRGMESFHGPRRKMVADPHRGYKLAPDLRTEYADGAVLTTNSRGLRGRQERAIPKPPGARRIVALGDSLTLGNGVADDEAWPARLETLLPGTEVLNLGCEAYAHDQMLAALEDDGLAFQPDIVILGFHERDLERNTLEFFCHEKPRWQRTANGWVIGNLPVPSPGQIRMKYLALPMVYLLPRLLAELIDARQRPMGDGRAEAEAILDRMKQVAEAAGARFLVVDLPLLAGRSSRAFFTRWCARTGAECIDTQPAFEKAVAGDIEAAIRSGIVQADRWHYGPAGNRIVATALRDYLATVPGAGREDAATTPGPD